MLVFVSDLHLADHPHGGVVSEDELLDFVKVLKVFAEVAGVKLVLLGDIVDLLRSSKWQQCAETHNSYPWSAMGPEFIHFQESPAEDCAVQVLEGIAQRYAKFGTELRKLVETEKLHVVYVYGNHDYMVRLSSKLQQMLIEFLGLKSRTNLRTSYTNADASVYAIHGHEKDPLNFHQFHEGRWAIGDAVVLQISNRFVQLALKRLGQSHETKLGRQLHDIENVEPLIDIPIFIRWIAEESLTSKSQRSALLGVWDGVVSDFLDLKDFEGFPGATALRAALRLSKSKALSDIVHYVANKWQPVDYRKCAQDDARAMGLKYRFTVYGHTHQPLLVPMDRMLQRTPLFYVNTGCWRRVVMRPNAKQGGPFVGRRVSSYFWIDDKGNTPSYGRYHLHQEFHTF